MREPHRAWLRFYAGLNDFLKPAQRGRRIAHEFFVPPAVKDAIEACGVPHAEVGLILVNGVSAAFRDRLPPGAEISVYPVFAALDVGALQRVRPAPLREVRFAVDANLGRLAQLLRLAGFDTLYRNDFDDAGLADLAAATQRILLTRDIGLLKRRQVSHGWFVRATKPEAQLVSVLRRFNLERQLQPFTRCLRCNGELGPATAAEVAERVPLRVRESTTLFSRCHGCGRVYWPGTHYRRMQQFVQAVQAELAAGEDDGAARSAPDIPQDFAP
jgi:uncharacterized protein with PIN domain